MDKMRIEIWSDIACPYCYIGKRKLENALMQFPDKDKIDIEWRSYELNPSLPKKALDKSFYSYFAEGHDMTVEQAKQEMLGIVALAKEVGLNYNFDKLIIANTSDALRLVKMSKTVNKSTEAEEELFKAYFVDGLDISSHELLISIGEKLGLAAKDVKKMLDSDVYVEDIKRDIEYSEDELNLNYIPFYLFNNKHVVQGSIAPEQYLEVLKKSFAEWQHSGKGNGGGDAIQGKSCSIDGTCSI